MSPTHYYEVHLEWKEGRKGELSSPVLHTRIECATPPEFPSGVPGIWSPEHLYAASINSCYMATFLAFAENFKLQLEQFECKTVAKLEVVEGKFLITEAEIFPVVQLVHPDTDGEKARRVMEKAKNSCLVTNSMKTAVVLHPELV